MRSHKACDYNKDIAMLAIHFAVSPNALHSYTYNTSACVSQIQITDCCKVCIACIYTFTNIMTAQIQYVFEQFSKLKLSTWP